MVWGVLCEFIGSSGLAKPIIAMAMRVFSAGDYHLSRVSPVCMCFDSRMDIWTFGTVSLFSRVEFCTKSPKSQGLCINCWANIHVHEIRGWFWNWC